MGGFARRTSYWNAFARKYPSRQFLKIDGGSLFSFGAADASLVNRWMLEGSYRSNLDALNLTTWDLPVWQEIGDMVASKQLSAEWLKLPLVSANVTSRVPTFPAVKRYIIKELRPDPRSERRMRIGITGLLYDSEERASRSEFEVQDPETVARQLIEELRGKTDYRVFLMDADVGRGISLAIRVPGIDLIVVAHNYSSLSEPQAVGGSLVVMPVNEGRAVSEVRVVYDPKTLHMTAKTRVVPLDGTVPDDPGMGEMQHQAQLQLDAFHKTR
jgi:2',3'-cyclic-nucleotide 2'-phosphodiesterase (5'-nucleotidase family)